MAAALAAEALAQPAPAAAASGDPVRLGAINTETFLTQITNSTADDNALICDASGGGAGLRASSHSGTAVVGDRAQETAFRPFERSRRWRVRAEHHRRGRPQEKRQHALVGRQFAHRVHGATDSVDDSAVWGGENLGGGGIGVLGTTESGDAVGGRSNTGNGVADVSNTGTGVLGVCTGGTGVLASGRPR